MREYPNRELFAIRIRISIHEQRMMKEETTKWLLTLVTVEQEMTESLFMNIPKIKRSVCVSTGSFPQPAKAGADVTTEKSATNVFQCF